MIEIKENSNYRCIRSIIDIFEIHMDLAKIIVNNEQQPLSRMDGCLRRAVKLWVFPGRFRREGRGIQRKQFDAPSNPTCMKSVESLQGTGRDTVQTMCLVIHAFVRRVLITGWRLFGLIEYDGGRLGKIKEFLDIPPLLFFQFRKQMYYGY